MQAIDWLRKRLSAPPGLICIAVCQKTPRGFLRVASEYRSDHEEAVDRACQLIDQQCPGDRVIVNSVGAEEPFLQLERLPNGGVACDPPQYGHGVCRVYCIADATPHLVMGHDSCDLYLTSALRRVGGTMEPRSPPPDVAKQAKEDVDIRWFRLDLPFARLDMALLWKPDAAGLRSPSPPAAILRPCPTALCTRADGTPVGGPRTP